MDNLIYRDVWPSRGPFPSSSALVTCFLQYVAVEIQYAQARAVHGRTTLLEAASSSLPHGGVVLENCALIGRLVGSVLEIHNMCVSLFCSI